MIAMIVSVAVAVAFTVVASVFDDYRQVAAENLRGSEVGAVPAGNAQVLKFDDWGVSLTVPYGVGMPQVRFAAQGPDSYGLSSSEVEKAGQACMASNNAVGVVVRVPAGTPLASDQGRVPQSLGEVGQYNYVYETPVSACAATGAAAQAKNESMVIEGDAQLDAM
jgi:hypothetical protein